MDTHNASVCAGAPASLVLLERGASATAQDDLSRTPLNCAGRYGDRCGMVPVVAAIEAKGATF